MTVPRILLVCLLLLVTGCSKESLLRSSLEDAEERSDTLQLTLKIFDEHPEYVDELFVLAKAHDPTFDRLVQQAASALDDEAFGALLAGKLANHPKAVEVITRAMLAEARTRPEIRRAFVLAILAYPDVMNQMISENPELVQQVLIRSVRGAPAASPPPPPSK